MSTPDASFLSRFARAAALLCGCTLAGAVVFPVAALDFTGTTNASDVRCGARTGLCVGGIYLLGRRKRRMAAPRP